MNKGFRSLYESAFFKIKGKKANEIKLKTFPSEDALQKFIENNIETVGWEIDILKPRYRIRGIGEIDLLCQDWDGYRLMVIELKKGKITAQHVGQVLSYGSWVLENVTELIKEFLEPEDQEEIDWYIKEGFAEKVRLAIIGGEFTEKAWSAIKSIDEHKFLVDVFEFSRFFHNREQIIQIIRVYSNYE